MKPSSPKVLVFALDGWGYKIIKEYIEIYKFPGLQRIVKEGVFGPLSSVIPYITVPAWPALLTGKNPGKLGVYTFLERNTNNYALMTVNLKWEHWNTLWNLLGNYGKKSIIINVPTVAAEDKEFPGMVISGPIMDKREDVIAYPEALNEELLKDNYKIYVSDFEKASPDDFFQEIIEITKKKFEHMVRLFRKEEWDFFMAGFYYGDVLQHRFWKYLDPSYHLFENNPKYAKIVLEYMQIVDGYIQILFNQIPQKCHVLVVSDHGMGPCRAKIDLNTWLLKNDYMSLWNEKIHSINLPNIRKYSLYFKVQNVYKKLIFLPFLRSIRNWFWEKLSKEERSWRDVNWEKTKAYGGWYSININLKGREPQGIVEPGNEYDNLCEEIILKLINFRDPNTGDLVFKKIYRKEEIYNGQYLSKMPDLIIEFASESLYFSTTRELAPGSKIIDYDTGYNGAHVRDGILFGYGDSIQKGISIKNASILDITPTILHLLDVPIPSDIDGKVLKEIFNPESSEFKREVHFTEVKESKDIVCESMVEEEDQRVKDRLRGLGYID